MERPTHLLLSRRKDETIVINPGPDQVLIRVNDIYGERVRISVIAPRDVMVMRGELTSAGS